MNIIGFAAALFSGLVLALLGSSPAKALVVVESDDFSDNTVSPSFLGALQAGTNTVSGTITPGDTDSISFTNPLASNLVITSLQLQVTDFTAPVGSFQVVAGVTGVGSPSAGFLTYTSNIPFTSLNSLNLSSTGNLRFDIQPLIATGGDPAAFGSYSYSLRIESLLVEEETPIPAPAPIAAGLLFPGIGWLRKRYRA